MGERMSRYGALRALPRVAKCLAENLRLPPPAARLTGREAFVGLGSLLALALLVFGRYVVEGGFHSDDWSIAAGYALASEPRYPEIVSLLAEINGGRPLLSVFAPLPHVLFGLRPGLHIANAITLGVLVSLLLYVLLRTVGLRRRDAGAFAVLAFLFPWSDATRFWPTAGVTNLAICFFLLGSIVAIRGLSRRGRSAAALHAGAVALYLMSALTYEVAAGAAMLSGVLYLTRAPWQAVRIRWLVDAVAVGIAIGYSAVVTSSVRYVPSVPYKLKVGPQDACEAMSVLVSSFVPVRLATPVVQVAVFGAIVTALTFLARRRLRSHLDEVRPWLVTGALGATWLIGGYAITLGSLHPLDPGANNRGNMFAALGFALLLYSLLMAVGILWGRGAWAPRAPALVLAAAALIAVGYVDRLQRDERLWLDAQSRQKAVLASLEQLGRPAAGSTIYAFGFPAHVATAVPVFAYSWDLDGAVKLLWDDSSLAAYPIHQRLRLICDEESVRPQGFGLGRENAASYPSALLVDVASGASFRPASQATCRAALARLEAGPWELRHTRSSCPLDDAARSVAASSRRSNALNTE